MHPPSTMAGPYPSSRKTLRVHHLLPRLCHRVCAEQGFRQPPKRKRAVNARLYGCTTHGRHVRHAAVRVGCHHRVGAHQVRQTKVANLQTAYTTKKNSSALVRHGWGTRTRPNPQLRCVLGCCAGMYKARIKALLTGACVCQLPPQRYGSVNTEPNLHYYHAPLDHKMMYI